MIAHSKDMKDRISAFREFWDGKHGDIAVQTNVEDQRLGVDVYAASTLEVNIIERKWGQGAKAIGGEVRVTDLQKAIQLKRRGYIVIPDPEDSKIQEAFKDGVFHSFERHSRVGMPTEKTFLEDVDTLRSQGVKHVTLKTGAYRPSAVAFAMKVASEGKLSYVTFDGAGGGTGMSPVPMMNEMGTPTVYVEVQVLKCAEILRKNGKYVPNLVVAGGFINETQICKAIALSNFAQGPYVKAILLGRAPITAVTKAAHFIQMVEKEELPRAFAQRYGNDPRKLFACTTELRSKFGQEFYDIPLEAMGVYSYLTDRIGVGLKQIMAGCRKWNLESLDRNDLFSLTERASKATGIALPEDSEIENLERILA